MGIFLKYTPMHILARLDAREDELERTLDACIYKCPRTHTHPFTYTYIQARLAAREDELERTQREARHLGGVLDAARNAGYEEGLELEEKLLAQVSLCVYTHHVYMYVRVQTCVYMCCVCARARVFVCAAQLELGNKLLAQVYALRTFKQICVFVFVYIYVYIYANKLT